MMTSPLDRFLSLTGAERKIVLEAATALPAAWLGLRIIGLDICKAEVARSVASKHSNSDGATAFESAQKVARLELATARHLFFRTTCLEQSLVLCWMLRRRGMNPSLRVGARKDSEIFEAHAWVELNGTVIGDAGGEHQHFEPFESQRVSLETQTH